MKENTKLPLLLVAALPILLLLSTEISDISFNVMGQPIYLSTFIFPLTFLVSALISKNTQSKVAITVVILSLIIQCFVFVLKWVFLGSVDYLLMEITFLAFFLSQFLLLLGYEVLIEIRKLDKFGYILMVLLVATLIETMFYVPFLANITIISVMITIVIKLVYDLIMAKILSE